MKCARMPRLSDRSAHTWHHFRYKDTLEPLPKARNRKSLAFRTRRHHSIPFDSLVRWQAYARRCPQVGRCFVYPRGTA